MLNVKQGEESIGLMVRLYKIEDDCFTQITSVKERLYHNLPVSTSFYTNQIIDNIQGELYILRVSNVVHQKWVAITIPILAQNNVSKRELAIGVEGYQSAKVFDKIGVYGNFQLISDMKELDYLLRQTGLSNKEAIKLYKESLIFKDNLINSVKVQELNITLEELISKKDITFTDTTNGEVEFTPQRRRMLL